MKRSKKNTLTSDHKINASGNLDESFNLIKSRDRLMSDN